MNKARMKNKKKIELKMIKTKNTNNYSGSDQCDPTSTFKPEDLFIDYPKIQLHQVQSKQEAQEIVDTQNPHNIQD